MKEIIIAIIGSGAFSAIISAIVAFITGKRNKATGIEKGLQILLYDRIKYLCKKYISEGCISPEDLEDLSRMWDVYHTPLHGNGYLDSLMAAVKKLPITR